MLSRSRMNPWVLDLDLFPMRYFNPKISFPLIFQDSERPYGTMSAAQWAGSTSQLYGFRAKDRRGSDAVPAWRAEVHRQQSQSHHHGGGGGGGGTLTRKSVERLDLETRSAHGGHGGRSRGQRMDPNATIRSHNLRGGSKHSKASLLELFHFSGSFRDLTDESGGSLTVSPPPSPDVGSQVHYSHHRHPQHSDYNPQLSSRGGGGPGETGGQRESTYGGVISPSQMPPGSKSPNSPYIRPQLYVPYADNDPSFRKSYPKAVSLSGLSDSAYPKQGDDSAISMGSRGDNTYGFNNDSEYSYNEYIENGSGSTVTGREENWSPPDDISALSVQEVSRSLRYIGMKDRVVLRFSNEQIDGSMLCSLDKRLLKEGFPELNALEIKKILDFVRGWRPKKR